MFERGGFADCAEGGVTSMIFLRADALLYQRKIS
jgi:hypothetical protein